MAASEGTIREVATIAGWTYERMARVLANKDKASPMELSAAIAALENMIEEKGALVGQRKKEIEEIEQQMIDLVHKATAGKINLPKGFHPHSFTSFLVRYLPRFPMLGIDLAMIAEASSTRTEIGPGVAVIERLEREGVIMFTENGETGYPGLFIAPEKMFSNTADAVIADRMVNYFDTRGEFSNEDGRIVGDKVNGEPVTVATWIAKANGAIQAISKELKISRRIVDETLYRMEARGFLAVKAIGGGYGCHVLVKDAINSLTRTERSIVECITVLYGCHEGSFQDGRMKLGVPVSPAVKMPEYYAYIHAIKQQYAATESLIEAVALARAQGTLLANDVPAAVNWEIEVKILKRAETFCWFAEPTRAVVSAAMTIMSSVRLERDMTPCNAGWWWFDTPLDIATTTEDTQIVALSWSWADMNETGKKSAWFGPAAGANVRGIIMSAYVMKSGDIPIPSTEFFWTEGTTLAAMLVDVNRALRGNHANDPEILKRMPMNIQACESMARFFAAGCLWLQQKILTQTRRPVERHERKRMEKARGVSEIADVQIVQLRKREVIAGASKPAPGESKSIAWSCQWIVGGAEGHWRNQWYPKKGYHQPKHIDPYFKGPADKPLRVSSRRVYAVKR